MRRIINVRSATPRGRVRSFGVARNPSYINVLRRRCVRVSRGVSFGIVVRRRNVGSGMWRSPVAHLNGVQGVAGSNPVIPIYKGTYSVSAVRALFRSRISRRNALSSAAVSFAIMRRADILLVTHNGVPTL